MLRLYAQAFGGEPVDERGAEEDVVVRLEVVSADGGLERCTQGECAASKRAASCASTRAARWLGAYWRF